MTVSAKTSVRLTASLTASRSASLRAASEPPIVTTASTTTIPRASWATTRRSCIGVSPRTSVSGVAIVRQLTSSAPLPWAPTPPASDADLDSPARGSAGESASGDWRSVVGSVPPGPAVVRATTVVAAVVTACATRVVAAVVAAARVGAVVVPGVVVRAVVGATATAAGRTGTGVVVAAAVVSTGVASVAAMVVPGVVVRTVIVGGVLAAVVVARVVVRAVVVAPAPVVRGVVRGPGARLVGRGGGRGAGRVIARDVAGYVYGDRLGERCVSREPEHGRYQRDDQAGDVEIDALHEFSWLFLRRCAPSGTTIGPPMDHPLSRDGRSTSGAERAPLPSDVRELSLLDLRGGLAPAGQQQEGSDADADEAAEDPDDGHRAPDEVQQTQVVLAVRDALLDRGVGELQGHVEHDGAVGQQALLVLLLVDDGAGPGLDPDGLLGLVGALDVASDLGIGLGDVHR